MQDEGRPHRLLYVSTTPDRVAHRSTPDVVTSNAASVRVARRIAWSGVSGRQCRLDAPVTVQRALSGAKATGVTERSVHFGPKGGVAPRLRGLAVEPCGRCWCSERNDLSARADRLSIFEGRRGIWIRDGARQLKNL